MKSSFAVPVVVPEVFRVIGSAGVAALGDDPTVVGGEDIESSEEADRVFRRAERSWGRGRRGCWSRAAGWRFWRRFGSMGRRKCGRSCRC